LQTSAEQVVGPLRALSHNTDNLLSSSPIVVFSIPQRFVCFISAVVLAVLGVSSSAVQKVPGNNRASGFAKHSSSLPKFIDVTSALGVRFKHESSATSQKYLVETMGAEVALFDCDGDGRLDLFFVNGAQ
jgi:hypothetical protein